MSKYVFYLTENAFIEFSKKEFERFRNVEYIDDNSKAKLINVTRFDKKRYQIIVPLDMIERTDK